MTDKDNCEECGKQITISYEICKQDASDNYNFLFDKSLCIQCALNYIQKELFQQNFISTKIREKENKEMK